MPHSLPDCAMAECQRRFHRRWQHLGDPHVRALAWLLDAPDLLDVHAPRWQGRVATLGADAGKRASAWLAGLDAAPAALHAHLQSHEQLRLGRYAEQLMEFYFHHQGCLRAHGLQVRAAQGLTVGEFDFLLDLAGRFTHWELATKFYLLPCTEPGAGLAPEAFVGPNLADTLGKKIDKILGSQLALSSRPEAQPFLPRPVERAQALMKGWLFYPSGKPAPVLPGLAPDHCRGYWCTLSQLAAYPAAGYALLPRLRWLAPARCGHAEVLEADALQRTLQERFQTGPAPLMVALLQPQGDAWLETQRVFVVPDGWHSRAIGQAREDRSRRQA